MTGLLAAAVATMAGCEAQVTPAPQATTPSVLDVNVPPPRPAYQTPVYTTPTYASAAPTSYAGPIYLPPPPGPSYVPPAVDATPVYTPMPGQTTYVVKQGDTLYHIARERYGDGKRWQQLAAANPGVTPTTLKVGQRLIVP
jgi:5'-nucleotidase